MGDRSGIQWTEASWNPVRGCSVISPGCHNCYAMKQAHRFSGTGKPYDGLTKLTVASGPQWNGEVRFIESMLDQPLRWTRPRRIFVNSMSDLFHDGVSNEQIAAVFGVMAASPQHTFQVLTKRPERMREWFRWYEGDSGAGASATAAVFAAEDATGRNLDVDHFCDARWPLPNVWLGVSAEDQKRWDERVPVLVDTPAALCWVSAEPLLGPIDMSGGIWEPPGSYFQLPGMSEPQWDSGNGFLDWIVVGGESGSGARPCRIEWVFNMVEQCRRAGVPIFVKQMGSNARAFRTGSRITWMTTKGGDPEEWPPELRVRQYPEVRP